LFCFVVLVIKWMCCIVQSSLSRTDAGVHTHCCVRVCGSVVYTSSDVGRRIADTLDSAEYCCHCQSACILPHARVQRRVDLRRVSASVTAVDVQGRTHVPCDGVVCSARCAARLTAKR